MIFNRVLLGLVLGGVALGCSSTTVNDDDATGGEAGSEAGGTGGETSSGGDSSGGRATGGETSDGGTAGNGGGGTPSGGTTTGGRETGGAETGGRETGGESGGGAEIGGESGGGAEIGGDAGAPAGTGGIQETGGAGGAETGGEGGAPVGTGGAQETGGAGGDAGSGTGGGEETGGNGGTGGGDTTVVHGNLIDFWGHPLPNVPMEVDGTITATDAEGAFEVADVSPEYDVSLVVEYESGWLYTYGWVFQGLTRRDPTLQIYSGLPRRSGNYSLTQSNGDFTGDRIFSAAFGGPDGADENSDIGEGGIGLASTDWRGPVQTTATAHGLLWRFDSSSDLPTSYVAYDSALVALAEGNTTNIQLDLTSEDITAGNLQGTAVPSGLGNRTNRVFVRFDTGAAIEVATDYDAPNLFTYLVPTLPGSSITVAASEGDGWYSPLAIAHADGLAAGAAPELTIPTPVTLLVPTDGAEGVDETTSFSFTGGAGVGNVRLISMQERDYYRGLYVVTTNEQLTIPEVVQGAFALSADSVVLWDVETHGAYDSVDEIAEPGGFLDPVGGADAPVGPRRGDGVYTQSYTRGFLTAP